MSAILYLRFAFKQRSHNYKLLSDTENGSNALSLLTIAVEEDYFTTSCLTEPGNVTILISLFDYLVFDQG